MDLTLKVLSFPTNPKTTNQILIKTIKLTETVKLIETRKITIITATKSITVTVTISMLIPISTLQSPINTTLRLIKDTLMKNKIITHH